jgi:ATP-dependent Clp protease ATP-binding subunit ClpA
MFERSNYRFRQVVFNAVREAQASGAQRLHVEHLALGLLQDDGLAGRFFADHGTVEAISSRLRGGVEPAPQHSRELPLTWGSHRTLRRASKLAVRMKHEYAGPEHLLLALVERKEVPCFAESGITPERVQAEIARLDPAAFALP